MSEGEALRHLGLLSLHVSLGKLLCNLIYPGLIVGWSELFLVELPDLAEAGKLVHDFLEVAAALARGAGDKEL